MSHSALYYTLSISCILTSTVYAAEQSQSPSLLGMVWAGVTSMISPSVQAPPLYHGTPIHESSPLYRAVLHSDIDALKMVLTNKQVDVNARDKDGRTVLHCVALNRSSNLLKLLLNDKRVDFTARDNDGWTALHCATLNRASDGLKILLNDKRVDFTTRDKHGWTALHLAARFGTNENVQILLDDGRFDLKALDNEGKTVLDIAIEEKQKPLIQLLRGYGAKRSLNELLSASSQRGDLAKATTSDQEVPLACVVDKEQLPIVVNVVVSTPSYESIQVDRQSNGDNLHNEGRNSTCNEWCRARKYLIGGSISLVGFLATLAGIILDRG